MLPGMVIVGSWCVLFSVPFQAVSVRLPHPANFARHKLLISSRRHGDKAERDREQAVAIMRTLHATGRDDRLRRVFMSLPPKWKAAIMRAIGIFGDDSIAALLPAAR